MGVDKEISSLSEVKGLDYPAFQVAIANLNILGAEYLLESVVFPNNNFSQEEKTKISILFNIEAEKVRLLLRRNVVWGSIDQLKAYEALSRKPLAECEDWHCNFNTTSHYESCENWPGKADNIYCYRHGGDPGDLEDINEFSIEEQEAISRQESVIRKTVDLSLDKDISEMTAIATKHLLKKCGQCKLNSLHWAENEIETEGQTNITCLYCLYIVNYDEVEDWDADI